MSIVRVMRLCFLFVIVIGLLGLSGCATFNQEVYDTSFNEIKKKAQNYLDEGKYPQTIILSKALLDAEPDDDEAQVFIKKALDAKPNLSVLTKKKLLGSNMSNRVHNDDFGWLGSLPVLRFPQDRPWLVLTDDIYRFVLQLMTLLRFSPSRHVHSWKRGPIQAESMQYLNIVQD